MSVERNEMDTAIQTLTPVVAATRFSEHAPLEKNGHRFIVDSGGLWIEGKRPWGKVLWPMAEVPSGVCIPFGSLKKGISLTFETLPKWPFEKFEAVCKAAGNNEVGAVLVFDSETGQLKLMPCETISSSHSHLRSVWPELTTSQSVCVDFHSHGFGEPFFSATDRKDMGANMVIAAVAGKTHQSKVEWVMSMFVAGMEIPLGSP